ncbi:hypothetical protein GCK72_011633 [Caenorhabditis remanei]|uniref:Uncharacterized protein n=1 Tax=Caenorhabditis remanei TaxID=31234 RepID=A0A6A5H842_CAERE|nr:hypothetical protein GCK72_011633 [Caenorhabditis remanei]KAF1763367.1 hypothetical protein GCK72_011633 [Caenorhabditis remanei]
MGDLLKNSEKKEDMSLFIRTITKLAMEEGDFISQGTLKELEEMLRPDELSESRDKLVGVDITPEQVETIKKVCEVVKGLVTVGKFVCDKLGPFLGPVGTVAGVVLDIISYLQPKEDDPVLKELRDLKNQLTALSQKMTTQFDDLKSFIVEQEFLNRYTISMTKLFMYMTDTMSERTKESVNLFEEIYTKAKPQELVYEMLAKLEQESTNPLKWAMKGDNLQSKATFEKWKGILESVLTEALFLETYAAGLLPSIGQHGVNKILEKIARYVELAKQWDEYYLNTETFWPAGVKKLVNDIHENRSLRTKEDIIEVLWKGIESIYTNFQFYAVVLPDEHIYAYYKHYEDQAIVSAREGFVIMVYRSARNPQATKEWLEYTVKDYLMIDTATEHFEVNKWTVVRNHYKQKKVDTIGRFFGSFYFVVAQDRDHVASRFSKIDGWDCGPGFLTYDAHLLVSYCIGLEKFPIFFLFGA